ncbi:Sapep family Mn(2+)-dependent dipeptidase [Fusibacter paucivorans]|uniref:Sapep family Mn(2+)-dependent dipeptidase n=1 Tax=Fusibacter paucivorans TaxID=76009 RepID=A0ABS5PS19_9FIRM|nr:Sapep family Mn(2+)-dependent dipeptidase [Fusibacter paucivorans]MBS7527662.1 Sapep family Mn(2+)-dependent dipeptidase [Fusibacter paucivorans]
MNVLQTAIENYLDDMVQFTSELVRIPSVRTDAKPGMPFGEGIADCLAFTLDKAKSLGFRTENIDNYVGYAEVGEGEEMIGILVHLDVVPVGDGWTVAPFGGEIKNGRIWGRGTCDDKYAAAIILYTIRALMDQGIQWQKRVRVIFGCDEETTWESIAYYKEKCEWPTFGFVPDAAFPLIRAEKGLLQFEINVPAGMDDAKLLSLKGGDRANVVLAQSIAVLPESVALTPSNNPDITITKNEKSVSVTCTGLAAHGASPKLGRNAGIHLMQFLRQNALKGNCIDLVCDLFGDSLTGEGFGIDYTDVESGSLSLNLGVLEKLEDGSFRIVTDIRYPVTADGEQLIKQIAAKLALYNATMTISSHKLPLNYAEDHPLVKTLMASYEKSTGRTDKTMSIGGSTYARSMPNFVAFGPQLAGEMIDHGCHKENEYIEIEEIRQASKIYIDVIEALQNCTL